MAGQRCRRRVQHFPSGQAWLLMLCWCGWWLLSKVRKLPSHLTLHWLFSLQLGGSHKTFLPSGPSIHLDSSTTQYPQRDWWVLTHDNPCSVTSVRWSPTTSNCRELAMDDPCPIIAHSWCPSGENWIPVTLPGATHFLSFWDFISYRKTFCFPLMCYVLGPTGSKTYWRGETKRWVRRTAIDCPSPERVPGDEGRTEDKIKTAGAKAEPSVPSGTLERDEGEVSNISSEVVATSTRNIYTSVWNVQSMVKG